MSISSSPGCVSERRSSALTDAASTEPRARPSGRVPPRSVTRLRRFAPPWTLEPRGRRPIRAPASLVFVGETDPPFSLRWSWEGRDRHPDALGARAEARVVVVAGVADLVVVGASGL